MIISINFLQYSSFHAAIHETSLNTVCIQILCTKSNHGLCFYNCMSVFNPPEPLCTLSMDEWLESKVFVLIMIIILLIIIVFCGSGPSSNVTSDGTQRPTNGTYSFIANWINFATSSPTIHTHRNTYIVSIYSFTEIYRIVIRWAEGMEWILPYNAYRINHGNSKTRTLLSPNYFLVNHIYSSMLCEHQSIHILCWNY